MNIIAIAEKHINVGPMASSARVRWEDARKFVKSDPERAEKLALESLKFSVGIFHPDFIRAEMHVKA